MKYAVVGTNWLCENYRAALALTGNEFAACVSRDAERAAAFSMGTARACTKLEEVLADDAIDAVYLCVPNALHADAAEACLKAGKHVLCEKPLTLTPEECSRLQTLADRKGLRLAEAVMNHYSPAMAPLRRALKDASPVSARLNYSQRSSKLDRIRAGGTASSFDRSLGGGALYDLGVYPLHFSANLFGAPREVLAAARWEGDVDVSDTLILRYEGFDAAVTVSKACQDFLGSEILCDGGSWCFDNVSVVLGARWVTKSAVTPLDCGEVGIPLAARKGASDGVQLAARVLRGFDSFVRGTDDESYLALRRESAIVQEIMAEARRQIGYTL